MLKKIPIKNLVLWPPRTGLFDHSPGAKALMDQSLQRHGALPRFVGRPHPTDKGKVEIPFGKLTWERIQKQFGPDHEVYVDVQPRSNVDMIYLFNIENSELWHNLPLHYIEVVDAAKTEIGRNGKATAVAIATFLGGDWVSKTGPNQRIQWCLAALELITSGDLKPADLFGLNNFQARELIWEVGRRVKQRAKDAELAELAAAQAKQEAERAVTEPARQAAERREKFERSRAQQFRETAKKEAKAIVGLGSEMREQKLAAVDLRRKAAEIAPPLPTTKALPWITQLAKRMASQFDQILAYDDARAEKLRELVKHRMQLDEFSKQLLGDALVALSDRALHLAQALDQSPSKPQANANPRQLK
jgi:hypothetical protein